MTRPASRALSVLVPLDASASVPMHRQVYAGLQWAILHGRLAAGTRIPSSRAFAADLGVSRTTVLLAFGQLVAEGYLTAARGSGTRVARELPERMMQVGPRPARAGSSRRGAPGETASPARHARHTVSRRGAALAATPSGGVRLGSGPRAFRLGTPALDLFPVTLWARLAARRARRVSPSMLDYGEPAGYRPLREAIAAYVGPARGVRCSAEQVIVVGGAQQGIDLTARLLLDPGDAAWIEDPGYLGARSALTAAGARIVSVPVDEDGIDVGAGVARGGGARLVYCSPSHQYPLGATMSLARRLALLRWASKAGAWVVEDDYDSEYRYAGRPLMALHGLDADERVVYAGTFSKTLFPGLRLGFLVVPADLADSFVAARAVGDQHPPALEQAVLADFIAEGHFARHVRRMRTRYQERQEMLCDFAARELGGRLALQPSGAGMHLVGWLPPGLDDRAVAAAAAARGVEVAALSLYYHAGIAPRPGLVLGYAAVGEREMREGMRVLARVLAKGRGTWD